MAGEVGDREQHVAQFLFDPRLCPGGSAGPVAGRLAVQLAEFLGHLGAHGFGRVPVETDTGRFLAETVGADQGRQGDRDAVQRGTLAAGVPLALFPHRRDFGRGTRPCLVLLVAEDVRVAHDHLVDHGADRSAEGYLLQFGAGQPGDVHRLEQQIAQFLVDRGGIAFVDRRGQFVGFLDQIGPKIRQ